MSSPIDIDALRLAMQSDATTTPPRIVALLVALALFGVILETVRRRKIREEFTPVWMTCAFVILGLGLSLDSLIWFTNLIGAWTPSSTVFFFGLIFLLAICLGYAVRLSQLSNRVKILAQELAIMKASEPGSVAPRDDVGRPSS